MHFYILKQIFLSLHYTARKPMPSCLAKESQSQAVNTSGHKTFQALSPTFKKVGHSHQTEDTTNDFNISINRQGITLKSRYLKGRGFVVIIKWMH